MDAINTRYGKGKVSPLGVFASLWVAPPPARGGYAQGLGARSWHMKRQKLSSRPTTRWDELMTAK